MLQIAPGLQFKRESVTPTGRFSGHVSLFDVVDAMGDVVSAGAFRKSLAGWAQLGKLPPMLLQHGGLVFGGTAQDLVPIGRWTRMEEDAKGLAVDGELFATDTERGRYITEAMRAGVLDGLSIGYTPVGIRYAEKAGEPSRTLTEVDLHEVSVVTFPANPGARIEQVKAQCARDLEAQLRQLGYSRRQAKAIVSHGWRGLSDSHDPDLAAAAGELRRFTAALRG